MSIFTVNTTADTVANDGKLSLREAVARANATSGADTIRFTAALEGKILVLTGGELLLTRDLTIDGDRDNDGKEVTISGGDVSRIFRITGGNTDVRLTDLALTDGRTFAGGGAIYAEHATTLRLDQVTVSGNGAQPDDGGTQYSGGGILALGDLVLAHCTIRGNYARDGGGSRPATSL